MKTESINLNFCSGSVSEKNHIHANSSFTKQHVASSTLWLHLKADLDSCKRLHSPLITTMLSSFSDMHSTSVWDTPKNNPERWRGKTELFIASLRFGFK